MPQTAKAQNLPPKMVPFQIFQDASSNKSSKPTSQKDCFSKSSKMPQTAKAQNLHPKMVPFQIFQDASSSNSSKPTSQNAAFPNLPTCLKQQELKTYIPKWCLSKSSKMPQTAKSQNLHPKMTPFQIFQDASNSKSSKPTSQNFAFPNLPTCLKQQELKTNIPKGCLSKSSKMPQTAKAQNLYPKILPFQIFQDASNSKNSKPTSQIVAFPNLPRCQKQQQLKTYIPKCCLCKPSKMPRTAKAQNLHPKMLPFQIFQDASNSKSSKPTSQNVAFPKLPTLAKCKERNNKRSKSIYQNVGFPNLPRCLKQQKLKTYLPKWSLSKSSKMPQTAKAQNLHPQMLPFQIFQHALNSKNSKPTSQNVAFPNLPKCLKRQKLKNLHPKMVPFEIVQDASNSKSSKPTSQNDAFQIFPRCLKQPKLKTYIPKWCLSKSSKMPQTAKAQKPTSKNVAFPNLPA